MLKVKNEVNNLAVPSKQFIPRKPIENIYILRVGYFNNKHVFIKIHSPALVWFHFLKYRGRYSMIFAFKHKASVQVRSKQTGFEIKSQNTFGERNHVNKMESGSIENDGFSCLILFVYAIFKRLMANDWIG